MLSNGQHFDYSRLGSYGTVVVTVDSRYQYLLLTGYLPIPARSVITLLDAQQTNAAQKLDPRVDLGVPVPWKPVPGIFLY